MTTFIAIYLVLVAVVLAIKVLRDHASGACELLSIRNMAIAGFMMFQLSSGAWALGTGQHWKRPPENPAWAGFQFALMATVFLVIALWSYGRGWVVSGLAKRVPVTWASPQGGSLLAMSVAVTVLATAMRLAVNVPLLSIIAGHVGAGLAAVACGLVGWVWGRRLLNPALILFGTAIVGVNLLLVMYGSFGRRGIIAVGGALLWGMYYSHWRFLPTGTLLRRLAIMSLPCLLFVGLFSSVRGQIREAGLTPEAQLHYLTQEGDAGAGLAGVLAGQGAGSISMWLIENYPERFAYRHLMTIRYFLVYPVPRAWWPSKPEPLSAQIASQASIPHVRQDVLTLGPGVIGCAAAEGGWYALIVYAIVAGLFLRFFDEIVRLNLESPFVVLAVGSALGHILGLARGSVDAFAFLAVMTILGSLACMVVIGKLVERTSGVPPPAAEEIESEDPPLAEDEEREPESPDHAAAR